ITLQIVFYDRTTLGPFHLKDKHKNVTAETYVSKWNTQHANEKRILILFVKDQHDGNYKFTNFEVSNLPHIFPVVENYIQEQIMAKSDSTAQVINDGLNALKNAYDDQFHKALENNGVNYVEKDIYKRNHAYWGPQSYYNFYSYHAEETENNETGDETHIDNTYVDINDEAYQDMIEEITNNELVKSDEYFDWSDFENPDVTGPELSIAFTPYTQDFLDNIQDQELINDLKAIQETTLALPQAINENEYFPKTDNSGTPFHSRSYLEKELKEIAENPKHTNSYETSDDFSNVHDESNYRYRKHNCRVKINYKQVEEGKSLNNRAREVILGVDDKGNPKDYYYCNKYVEDMMELIFPQNKQSNQLFWGKELTANKIFNHLTQAGYNDVIDVSDQGKNQIWEYIKDGYIVIIAWYNKGDIGHVVLGWPEDDKVIGAGTTSKINKITQEFPNLESEENKGNLKYFLFSGYLLKNY
ncbi:MAG: hypothetical protein ACLFUH_11435, partial [Bacteroidales bacterium]